MREYGVIDIDAVPLTDLSTEDVPPDLTIREIDDALDLENVRMNVWYFEPGDGIGYHAHTTQEEIYYVVRGRFSVKIGRSGQTEIIEVGPGSFYAAPPGVGHGHRYLGDDRGMIVAIGAPAVNDPGLDPHSLDDSD